MSEVKSQILIVEDDLDLAEMLNSYFRVQGYEVQTAAWGNDAVQIAQENTPDLIVLDIRLPDIDGYEVCKQIRSSRRTAHLPVIFLTEKRDRVDKLAGLELGVVDYITKPFDIQELRLRVRNALSRAQQSPKLNPVTNIPEETMTDDYLVDLLQSDHVWTLISLRILGLDHFREQYGFVASDDVLRAITLMINNAVNDIGSEGDFVGHFNRDDFMIMTSPQVANAIRERIENRLQQSLAYPIKDRSQIDDIPTDERLRLDIGIVQSDVEYEDLDTLKKIVLRSHDRA